MRRDVLQLRIDLLELLVGFLQLFVVAARLRLQMGIVDEQNRGDREDCECDHGDRDGKPAVVGGGGARAVGAGGESRGRHAGVVHSTDGQPHHDRGTETSESHLPGAALAQAEEQPQRHERCRHGDGAGGQQQARRVSDHGEDLNGAHARVVHRADAEPHHDGPGREAPQTDLWAARDRECETGQPDCDRERGERRRGVVGQRDRQREGQHTDEVHRPDATTHGQGAANEPQARRRLVRATRHPGRQIQRGVRNKDGDEDGEQDEPRVVRADHSGGSRQMADTGRPKDIGLAAPHLSDYPRRASSLRLRSRARLPSVVGCDIPVPDYAAVAPLM